MCDDFSLENFINSVSIAFNINEEIAEKIITTYSESLTSANNGEIQFAKFADALYRLSKINKKGNAKNNKKTVPR